MHPFQRFLDILGWTAFAVFMISFTVFMVSDTQWMLENIVILNYAIFGGFAVGAFRVICWVLFPHKELVAELRRRG